MKTGSRILVITLLFFIGSFPDILQAQVSMGGVPRSFSLALPDDTNGYINVTPPAYDALILEDEQNPVPYRFSINLQVDLEPASSGHWSKASDGSNVWRLKIKSPGALALTLYFDRYHMPEDGKLFVYNPRRTQLIGAFTHENNSNRSTFATALIYGDQLIIEYNAPDGVPAPDMHISEVAYAYRGVADYSGLKTGFGSSGACEVNANCLEGDNWQKEKRGVTRIQVKRGGGNFWCTGSLVNNTKNDGKPYILTADHCGNLSSAVDISQWIFYFNYEGSGCPDPVNEPALKSITGAGMVAHGGNSGNNGSDFYLVLLNETIPESYHVYYNGWSRETDPPSPSGVGIHHPAGDIKKISTSTQPLQQSTWNGGAFISHWLVMWSGTINGHGTTEGGSSGSPLFDNQGRLVGTLTGGESSCDSAKLNLPDYYGQFAYHWESNGTDSASVLKYWLDPVNSGVMSLNGWAVSIDEPGVAGWIKIYPNPVTDLLYLKATTPNEKHIQVIISDLRGKEVLKSELNFSQNQEYSINMTSLAGGMYLAKITNGERQVVQKIIKQ